MSGQCGVILGGNGARDIVEAKFSLAQNYAANSYSVALSAMNAISALSIPDIDVNSTIDSPLVGLTPFTKPIVPADPALEFVDQGNPPVEPALLQPDLTWSFSSKPTFTATTPTVTIPDKPDPFNRAEPGDPPALTDVTLPTEPAIVIPAVPTLRELALPTLATIDLGSLRTDYTNIWNARPQAASFSLGSTYPTDVTTWYGDTNTRSNTYLATNPANGQTATRILALLTGGTGLTAAVEAQLRDRAYAAEDRAALKGEQEVYDDFAARGFSLPQGILLNRLDAIREQNRDRRAALSREIFVKAAEWEIENLRFGVQQGLALEGLFRQHFLALHDRGEAVAWKIFETGKAIFDAKARLQELELARFRDAMATFEARLKVELSELEVYRAKIEAEKLKGELNQQDLEAYKAALQGVLARVEVYKGQIQAVNAIIQQDQSRVEAYRAQVQAFTSLVEAKDSEWNAFDSAVKAELGRVSIFESLTRAFSEQMKGYETDVRAKQLQEQFKVDWDRLLIERFQAMIQQFTAQLNSEVERVRAGVSIYNGRAQIYSAELGAEGARVAADTRAYELDMRRGELEAELRLKAAQINIEELQKATALLSDNLRSIAQTASQVSAAALAGVSASASLGSTSGMSESIECTTSYQIRSSA